MIKGSHFVCFSLLILLLCLFSCSGESSSGDAQAAAPQEASSNELDALDANELAVQVAKKTAPINKDDEDFIRDVVNNADDLEAIQKSQEAYLKKMLGDEAYEARKKVTEAWQSGDASKIREAMEDDPTLQYRDAADKELKEKCAKGLKHEICDSLKKCSIDNDCKGYADALRGQAGMIALRKVGQK